MLHRTCGDLGFAQESGMDFCLVVRDFDNGWTCSADIGTWTAASSYCDSLSARLCRYFLQCRTAAAPNATPTSARFAT